MMKYFKIVYLLSGKYRSTYQAKILSWQNGVLNIRDDNGREYNLKEEFILSLKQIGKEKTVSNSNKEANINDLNQSGLFE